MKKIMIAGTAGLFIVIACHKKTIPVVTGMPVQPAWAAADLEAGKVIYETKCARCHAAKPVDDYTAARWEGILRSMVPRTKLDSVQKTQLTAYVNTHAKKS